VFILDDLWVENFKKNLPVPKLEDSLESSHNCCDENGSNMQKNEEAKAQDEEKVQ